MDWYRKKSWGKNEEEHFFTKLNRARKENRTQYLKVQAIELMETGIPDLFDVAEKLLNQALKEFPNDKLHRSSILNSLGEIHQYRNEIPTALEYFKMAVLFEQEFPNVQTQACLNYSELIIQNNFSDQFGFVKELILERFKTAIFPIEKYKMALILSFISKKEGNLGHANYYSELAEKNAIETTSGLRFHKDIGVVKERNTWLERLVKHE